MTEGREKTGWANKFYCNATDNSSSTNGNGILGIFFATTDNRPRSIYQYSNMGPRLSGLTSIFGVVFFVSKSPLGIEGQKKL